MVHTAVIYCQTLDKDLNNYENKLFYIKKYNFYVITVIYVISSITPYKIK